jgi:hypothetical protein
MQLSEQQRRAKLDRLAAIEGFDQADDLLEAVAHDSVSPGICVQPDCDYSCEVEPDQDRGWCEACRTQTVRSALILAELI